MASYEPAKSSGNGLQSPAIVEGVVTRRNQQAEQLDRLSVNGVKLDAARKPCQHTNHPLDTGVGSMRHGEPPANTGGGQALALQDRRHDALAVGGAQLAGLYQPTNNGTDRLLFRARLGSR